MVTYVQGLLQKGQLTQAEAYMFSGEVTHRSVDRVKNDEEDTVLFAQILSVKRPKTDARKLLYSTGGSISKYDLLILFREIMHGGCFYMIFKTSNETHRALLHLSPPYLGRTVALYEPTQAATVHNINVIECSTSLVPLTCQIQNMRVTDWTEHLPDLEDAQHVGTFLVQLNSIKVSRACAISACSSRECDSNHMPYKPCPFNGNASSFALCISLNITLDCKRYDYSIYNNVFSFTSENLAKIFVHKDSLKLKMLDVDELRRAVAQVVAYYKEQGVPWLCACWFKRCYEDDGSPSSYRNLHISSLWPKRVLEDAPLYRETPESNLAIEYPIHG
ncbi:uncharacterized protein LOC108669771 [Hyalella azteca]|uniref:Uncharacterized protein LOC108669771 n=1 Tax=Hyalella azteca TaxID=294128 RepID=A0A8B7NGB8_HYAAZ|nr:uncharacterized protein LOC108669771 [Hyalella azteca]